MKLEDLVLTIEQAKHLQELGLDMRDAAFGWFYHPLNCEMIVTKNTKEAIPTYSLQEILAKLTERILIGGKRYYKHIDDVDCRVWYESIYVSDRCAEEDGETLLDASYKMLCWLIENNHLNKYTE